MVGGGILGWLSVRVPAVEASIPRSVLTLGFLIGRCSRAGSLGEHTS